MDTKPHTNRTIQPLCVQLTSNTNIDIDINVDITNRTPTAHAN